MPVLARWFEEAGIPTVVVTMMPDVAVALDAPRVLGVEFPFGHPFGVAGDRTMQRAVTTTALALLAGADEPVSRVDMDVTWPVPRREAYKAWQPDEPSPIVRMMTEQDG